MVGGERGPFWSWFGVVWTMEVRAGRMIDGLWLSAQPALDDWGNLEERLVEPTRLALEQTGGFEIGAPTK